MNDAIERLKSLRVVDVMSRSVVQVVDDQTMPDVAMLFRQQDVSAAPVVNGAGECVGVLSATDFLRRESARTAGSGEPPQNGGTADDSVKTHMSPAVQSVAEHAPLLSAARVMDAQHVHRLVVLNELAQPIGVISTMDIVAALLNAIEEMETRLQ